MSRVFFLARLEAGLNGETDIRVAAFAVLPIWLDFLCRKLMVLIVKCLLSSICIVDNLLRVLSCVVNFNGDISAYFNLVTEKKVGLFSVQKWG